MCNILKDDAIKVAKRYPTADDKQLVAAHRSLDNFVDETHAGIHTVLHDDLQEAKAYRLLLRREMESRGIESSARPARQATNRHDLQPTT